MAVLNENSAFDAIPNDLVTAPKAPLVLSMAAIVMLSFWFAIFFHLKIRQPFVEFGDGDLFHLFDRFTQAIRQCNDVHSQRIAL